MSTGKFTRRTLAAVSAVAAIGFSSNSTATDSVMVPFTAAAQEISQLFWLAETANACGWATRGEAERFELFAVRFLATHLEGTYQIGMVGDERYLHKVRSAAVENTDESCQLPRWHNGWVAYRAAAEENYARY